MTKKKSIIVFCAHPDDEVIGPGGALLKFAKEGIDTHVVIFSGGEKSHSYYDKKKLLKLRHRESEKAGKILGVKKIVNLGLRDMGLTTDAKDPKIRASLKKMILKLNPEKIFTHAIDDMLYIDHRAVHDCVTTIVKEINKERENKKRLSVYTFNIWTLNIRKRNSPRLVIDISKEMQDKMKALREFKSQKLALIQLTPVVFIRAILSGFKHDCKYAEEFYKII